MSEKNHNPNEPIDSALSLVGLNARYIRPLIYYIRRCYRDLVPALAVTFSAIGIVTVGSAMTLLCIGCATPLQENLESRQAYVDSHNLKGTIQKAVLAGRVSPGMTREDVYATWGYPSETDTSESLGLNGQYGKEVWIYESFLSLTPEAEVFFRNGVVYSVSPEYLSDVPQN